MCCADLGDCRVESHDFGTRLSQRPRNLALAAVDGEQSSTAVKKSRHGRDKLFGAFGTCIAGERALPPLRVIIPRRHPS